MTKINSSSKEEEVKQPAIVKVNLDTLVSMKNLGWNVKARLVHYIQVNKIYGELEISQWEKILNKL